MKIVEFKLYKRNFQNKKNRAKLQSIILLYLRDLSQNNFLTKIKSNLEMKIAKPQKLKGRKQAKITQGSRGVPWLL